MQDIQVMLKSDAHHASIRSLKVLAFIAAVTHSWSLLVPWTSVVVPHLQSDQVSRLVKVHGIIISATAVKAKATKVCLQCRGCRNIISNIPLPPGLQGYALPRKCNSWVPDLNRKHVGDCAKIFYIVQPWIEPVISLKHGVSFMGETCGKGATINDRRALIQKKQARPLAKNDTHALLSCHCRENPTQMKCPVDPYFIIPDRCVCIDFQTLRLQESPDAVPHGEMPRHLQLYCDRWGPSGCFCLFVCLFLMYAQIVKD